MGVNQLFMEAQIEGRDVTDSSNMADCVREREEGEKNEEMKKKGRLESFRVVCASLPPLFGWRFSSSCVGFLVFCVEILHVDLFIYYYYFYCYDLEGT